MVLIRKRKPSVLLSNFSLLVDLTVEWFNAKSYADPSSLIKRPYPD